MVLRQNYFSQLVFTYYFEHKGGGKPKQSCLWKV